MGINANGKSGKCSYSRIWNLRIKTLFFKPFSFQVTVSVVTIVRHSILKFCIHVSKMYQLFLLPRGSHISTTATVLPLDLLISVWCVWPLTVVFHNSCRARVVCVCISDSLNLAWMFQFRFLENQFYFLKSSVRYNKNLVKLHSGHSKRIHTLAIPILHWRQTFLSLIKFRCFSKAGTFIILR